MLHGQWHQAADSFLLSSDHGVMILEVTICCLPSTEDMNKPFISIGHLVIYSCRLWSEIAVCLSINLISKGWLISTFFLIDITLFTLFALMGR